MAKMLENAGNAGIIIALAVMLLGGFLLTRVTKLLRLPNVTGYIISGVLIGPYVLGLIPQSLIAGMDFVTDIALGFIAFGVGKYFKLSTLRNDGTKTIVLTLCEALAAALFIALAMILIFRLPVPFALLIAAIGSATAPASTIMTIRQYKAKGRFVDTMLQVVALDDAVALIAFSVSMAVCQALGAGGQVTAGIILLPLGLNVAAAGAGIAAGLGLNRLINERRSKDHRLVVVCVFILALCGLCALGNISPLLACMAMGASYINTSKNGRLFKQVNQLIPPVLVIFFVLSGMRLNVPALATAGLVGVAYFLVRILGKGAGAYLGARITGAEEGVRRYLGLGLIPQAGVSIGLAALAQRMLPPETGTLLSTIILSSAVLYELVGPACAKAALTLAGAIPGGRGKAEGTQAKPAKLAKAKKNAHCSA